MASTTPLAAPAMLPGSTITVLLQRPIDAERRLLTAAIPRSNLVAHSGGFRRFLSGWPVEDELHRAVTLPEGSPGGLKHVLGIIRMHGHEEDLFINIGGMGLPRTIAIWEACEIIDIEPKSALEKLTAHICYRVSHEKVTPEVMDRVQRVFSPALAPGNAERRRPWDSLVAQYSWDLIHDAFTTEERQALEAVINFYSDLSRAIKDKLTELRPKKMLHDLQQSLNKRRGIGSSRRQNTHFKNREQKLQREAAEVRDGLREWRAELEPYLRPPMASYMEAVVDRRESAKKEKEGRMKKPGEDGK